ncbi:MAG: VOC family protein, partial [Planctomycetota bacterium]|nr:VOC family protein [Planctomycetota bacterium]
MKTPDANVGPHWLSYIAVEDVDSATKKAEQLGAKTDVPPTDIPGTGRFSVITDPTGALIALFQGK